LIVRPFAPGDTDAVFALWRMLLAHGEQLDPRYRAWPDDTAMARAQARAGWSAQRPFPACWVAASDAAVVGFLELRAAADPVLDRRGVAQVVAVFVDPAARRQGVARGLLTTAADAAARAGCPTLEVGTLAADAAAVAFWSAMCFGPFQLVLRRAPG
jgi:GNAT superfamily N-acetyltransferase